MLAFYSHSHLPHAWQYQSDHHLSNCHFKNVRYMESYNMELSRVVGFLHPASTWLYQQLFLFHCWVVLHAVTGPHLFIVSPTKGARLLPVQGCYEWSGHGHSCADVQIQFSLLSDAISKSMTARLYSNHGFSFLRNDHLFSRVAVTFYTLTSDIWCSFFASLPTLQKYDWYF